MVGPVFSCLPGMEAAGAFLPSVNVFRALLGLLTPAAPVVPNLEREDVVKKFNQWKTESDVPVTYATMGDITTDNVNSEEKCVPTRSDSGATSGHSCAGLDDGRAPSLVRAESYIFV